MIKVVAKKMVKGDKINKIIELTKELAQETLKEEGCIKYEMYQDDKDSKILIMIEEWENIEALNSHISSEHFRRIVPQMDEFIEKKLEMNICRKLV